MRTRDLLRRLDTHLERGNAHMARGNAHMARGNELLAENIREGRALRGVIEELRKEMVAQRQALFRILDKLA